MTPTRKKIILTLAGAAGLCAAAQYTIDWHTIDGGGGTIGSAATATSPWANTSS